MPQINGREVGPIGYGLMGFTWRPNPCPQEQAFEAMRAALKNGCTFWNGGEFYGGPEYNSPVLLERYFEKYPEDADKIVLSIKGAGGARLEKGADGSPEEIRRSLDAVLSQLKGRKKLDLFECARRDPRVPLEVTFGEIQKYIDAGKLGGISLSEVNAQTIHDAVKITKVKAVEVELSLFSTDVLENGVAAACAQYDIPLVAYSPLCRGLLTSTFKSFDDIPEGDFRRYMPRFQGENFQHNITLVERVKTLADKKGVTPGQFALAWVRALSRRPGMPTIIPIPGATTVDRVNENSKLVDLTDEDMAAVDEILDKMDIKGTRYPAGAPTNT
ncbi:Aldo/keto reductase [Cryphonectria parasitica EP155]|uniref:Aldo/keto reductase n=1 Tax=Cryphonectria parasitica (strain ATCC 38755 / EP155) TaxID=660469 RepID=A0A9P4Y9E5_CRYP1|nr:Aldo/keto reductase [Cryphonectria parasitica EP155]KAF3769243.1 Aldo/keto reductase [Cryphonectria parasitica EP155]